MPVSRDFLIDAYKDACRAEIEALKPGNVHVFADGHRMSADQFLLSADVTALPLTEPGLALGRRILAAIRATREAVGTNTNLGIVLLAAPLLGAAERPGKNLRTAVGEVLGGFTMEDTAAVFDAIALASPGGLGAADNDVREPPTIGLLEAMKQASERDLIARQYANGMADIFDIGFTALAEAQALGETGMWPAVRLYLAFLTAFPDSHIIRKHGLAVAGAVQSEAASLAVGLDRQADEPARIDMLMTLDRRLKADGINPGTSADLTVASLLAQGLCQRLA